MKKRTPRRTKPTTRPLIWWRNVDPLADIISLPQSPLTLVIRRGDTDVLQLPLTGGSYAVTEAMLIGRKIRVKR